MEAQRLDDLAREIGSQVPRRSVLGALGGLAALLVAPKIETDAKKKKKKCKGGKKKCGKKCILADQCCTTADCGSKGQCVSGTCVCPTGQKACNGGCIPQASCCQNSECGAQQTCVNGACSCGGGLTTCGQSCISPDLCCGTTCPGNQQCDGGFCVCPASDEYPCGDGSCVTGVECCVNANCPKEQHCDDGTCWCDATGGIWCGDACCDAGSDEVCDSVGDDQSCASGGCQLFDWCNVDENSVCRSSETEYCVCITSYEAGDEEVPACVDGMAIGESCEPCDDSDGCGSGYVCVQGDTSEDGYCGCTGKFCAPLCDTGPERTPGRESERIGSVRRKEKPGRARERRSR
jgi:hypothetical protein